MTMKKLDSRMEENVSATHSPEQVAQMLEQVLANQQASAQREKRMQKMQFRIMKLLLWIKSKLTHEFAAIHGRIDRIWQLLKENKKQLLIAVSLLKAQTFWGDIAWDIVKELLKKRIGEARFEHWAHIADVIITPVYRFYTDCLSYFPETSHDTIKAATAILLIAALLNYTSSTGRSVRVGLGKLFKKQSASQ